MAIITDSHKAIIGLSVMVIVLVLAIITITGFALMVDTDTNLYDQLNIKRPANCQVHKNVQTSLDYDSFTVKCYK
jgi:hypothetical protein